MTGIPIRRAATAALFVSASALAGCATTSARPPVIAFDDPPPRSRDARGRAAPRGRDRHDPRAAAAARPVEAGRRRARDRQSPPIRVAVSARPTTPRASSRCATASSTPSSNIPGPKARSIRSIPRRPGDGHRLAGRRAARGAGAGRGRRHRAVDHRRHDERQRRDRARPHPRQAHPARSGHQPRHQHRPAHLSSGAARHALDLHGVGVLDLSAGRS
jgi:hypothetical protein